MLFKASLKEKITLLEEVHHRVKNNMAAISSLLKLQANSIQDNQVREIFKESQSRIFAMAAIHKILHSSENLSEINLGVYLSKVTASIFQTYSITSDQVVLKIDHEEMPISINQASLLGLIIRELMSNALKYAFSNGRKGEITVSMKKRPTAFALIVQDNGIGFADGLDWKNANTLGLTLLRTLVENQLDGSIDMENNNGTRIIIQFNIES